MICPDSDLDCDNPGCRRGGCQGRRPNLPLFRAGDGPALKSQPLLEAVMVGETVAMTASDNIQEGTRRGRLVAA